MKRLGDHLNKPKQPLAAPDEARDNVEHWDHVARLAHEASRQATSRQGRRYWKRSALAAERRAAQLRLAQQ